VWDDSARLCAEHSPTVARTPRAGDDVRATRQIRVATASLSMQKVHVIVTKRRRRSALVLSGENSVTVIRQNK